MKHTKGPWLIFPNESPTMVFCDDGAGSRIADCTSQHAVLLSKEEKIANAKLIAAAPDLLYALIGVIAVADRKTIEFDKAHAAIKKATE